MVLMFFYLSACLSLGPSNNGYPSSDILGVPAIYITDGLNRERAVISRAEDRLNRMEIVIARLGSTLERFIRSSSTRRTDEKKRVTKYVREKQNILLKFQERASAVRMLPTIHHKISKTFYLFYLLAWLSFTPSHVRSYQQISL